MDVTPTTNGKKAHTGAAEAIPPPIPPTIDYAVKMIDVHDVFASPLNPRKTWVLIEDLAADIQKRGILEPVIVRKRKGGGWELAAGERRWRAAKLVPLAEIPCLVRELTDPELLELAIAENMKRADLHPLEEAEAFQTLKTSHGYSVKMIAARFNKSESHVFQRLQLHNNLAPELRKLSLGGELDTTIAIYAARIPTHDMQRAFIKELHVDGTHNKPTARAAIDLIQRRYMLRLIDAPFDRTDAKLISSAPACSTCPKRTGNQTELFSDIKSPDMCTDPKCFDQKRNAGWDRRVATAKGAGIEVIKQVVPSYSSTPPRFVTLDMKPAEDKKGRTFRQLLKSALPKVEAIAKREDGTILDLVKEATVRKALVDAGHRFAEPSKPPKPSKSATSASKAKDELEEKTARRVAHAQVAAIAIAATKKTVPREVWRLIIELVDDVDPCLEMALTRRGITFEAGEAYKVKATAVQKMSEPELRGLMVEMLVATGSSGEFNARHISFQERVKLLAGLYGVDAKAIAKLAKEAVLAEAKTAVLAEGMVKPSKVDTTKRGGKKTTVKKGRR